MKNIPYLIILFFMLTALSVQGKTWQSQEGPEEKVYLHLAEEVWLTGQRTWFNAYLTEDHQFPPQNGSKVVYVELLNADRHQVLSSKLRVSNGTAKGEFLLSDTLSGGWYQVRAYTQWMRNFSPDVYFRRNILVINPFHPDAAGKIAGSQSKSKSPISFYPEGGHLVAGLDNHVVFQLNGTSGQDSVIHADVLGENDSIVASVVLLAHGLGSFRFHPLSAAAYYLRAVTPEDTLFYAIPPARQQGYAIQVKKAGNNFNVAVKTRKGAAEDVILIALSGGKAVWKEELNHSDHPWSVNIDQDIFPGSRGRIVLLHKNKGLLADRLVYIAHKPHIRVILSVDKKTYEPRENVQLDMSFQDMEGNPVIAQASLVVRKVNPLSGSWGNLSLQSDAPEYTERDEWFDSWLVMQHDNALDWNSLLRKQEMEKQFPKENEGMVLSGRVTNDQGKPLADTLLLLSIPSQNPVFDYYHTDAQGRFYFPVANISGEQEVIIQLPQRAGDYHVVLDEKYAPATSVFKAPRFFFPSDMLAQFTEAGRKRAEIAQVYNLYRKDTATTSKKDKKSPFRFYGAPNFERNLDDYISLPTFEEVCRELLPGVRLNKKNGSYDFDIFDVRTRSFLEGEPALLLDGVPVFQPEMIVNLSPDTIARIETVNRRTYYGEFPLNGTVAIYTKSGKEYLKALSSDVFRRSLSFYTRPLTFTDTYPAAVQPPDTRMPDFRTLLFWKPDVKTDAQGKAMFEFYNADETGQFEAIIEGMTDDGQPFSQVVRYTVVSSVN